MLVKLQVSTVALWADTGCFEELLDLVSCSTKQWRIFLEQPKDDEVPGRNLNPILSRSSCTSSLCMFCSHQRPSVSYLRLILQCIRTIRRGCSSGCSVEDCVFVYSFSHIIVVICFSHSSPSWEGMFCSKQIKKRLPGLRDAGSGCCVTSCESFPLCSQVEIGDYLEGCYSSVKSLEACGYKRCWGQETWDVMWWL